MCNKSNQSHKSQKSSDDEIKALLTNINANCEQTLEEVKALEGKTAKKAMVYGATSGAVTSLIVEIGIRLIKLQ